MAVKALVANNSDNVATLVKNAGEGDRITINNGGYEQEVVLNQSVPCFHKIALNDINKGEPVIKYGEVMGEATVDIKKGDYVHVHNVESKRGRGDKTNV